MNVAVIALFRYEGELDGIQDVAQDLVLALTERGYASDLENGDQVIKSIVFARENTEINDVGVEEFVRGQLEGSLFTVVPVIEKPDLEAIQEEVSG